MTLNEFVCLPPLRFMRIHGDDLDDNTHQVPDIDAEMEASYQWKKDFFLELNSLGRRNLLQVSTADRRPWIDTLARASYDVSALFYFLSKNPMLCAVSQDETY